jgi:sulfur-carrier protein
MSVTVRVPTALRKLTGDREIVESAGGNIAELISSLDTEFPGIRGKICDDSGALRRFVNVYVNGEDIRFLSGLNTEIGDGAEVSIVPSIAGG